MLFFSQLEINRTKRKGCVIDNVLPPDKKRRTIGKKRAPYAAFYMKASLTLEASIVLPFYVLAIIVLMFFIQAIQIQIRIQNALTTQTIKISGYAYYIDATGISAVPENFLEAEYIKSSVINELGEDFFNTSYIVNGKKGFSLNLSNIMDKGIIDVAIQYYMKVPYDMFGLGKIPFVARARCRAWIGDGTSKEEWNTTMVYVTEKGTVYHRERECTYIKSDILSCGFSEIDNVRNSSGAIYYPCSLCCVIEIKEGSKIYYTKYGTRYHSRYDCTNLQNNVFAVSLDDAKEKYRACSKCGNGGDEND